jgi:hypothetical protein
MDFFDSHNTSVDYLEVEHDLPEIGFKKMFANAHTNSGEGVPPGMILVSIETNRI